MQPTITLIALNTVLTVNTQFGTVSAFIGGATHCGLAEENTKLQMLTKTNLQWQIRVSFAITSKSGLTISMS